MCLGFFLSLNRCLFLKYLFPFSAVLQLEISSLQSHALGLRELDVPPLFVIRRRYRRSRPRTGGFGRGSRGSRWGRRLPPHLKIRRQQTSADVTDRVFTCCCNICLVTFTWTVRVWCLSGVQLIVAVAEPRGVVDEGCLARCRLCNEGEFRFYKLYTSCFLRRFHPPTWKHRASVMSNTKLQTPTDSVQGQKVSGEEVGWILYSLPMMVDPSLNLNNWSRWMTWTDPEWLWRSCLCFRSIPQTRCWRFQTSPLRSLTLGRTEDLWGQSLRRFPSLHL